MHRRLRAQRSRQLFDQEAATLGHAHRGFDEDAHRLLESGSDVVEKGGNVLEPSDRRRGLLGRGAIGGQQQVMQTPQEV